MKTLVSRLEFFRIVSIGALKSDLLRVSVTLISIALGVATMLAIRLANQAAVESFKEAALGVNSQADLFVSRSGSSGLNPSDFSVIEKVLRSYGEVEPIRVGYVKDASSEKLIQLYAIDFVTSSEASSGFTANLGDSKFKDLFKPGAILLSDSLMSQLGSEIGDEREVYNFQGRTQIRILGSFDTDSPSRYALVDLSQLQYFFGSDELTRVELTLASSNKDSADAIANELSEELPEFAVHRPIESLGGREKMVEAFHFNMNSLGYVSVLVGLLVVSTVTSLSIHRRMYELGLMRTLGASVAELRFVFVLENILLGLPAIGLGLFFGTYAAQYLVMASAETTAVFYLANAAIEGLQQAKMSVLEACRVVGVALAAIFVATVLSARQLRHVSEIQILRKKSALPMSEAGFTYLSFFLFLLGYGLSCLPPVGDIPAFGFCSAIAYLLAAVALFPAVFQLVTQAAGLLMAAMPSRLRASALMALSGCRSGRSLIIPAASSLIVSMAMTIAVLVMVGSFRETVKLWVGGALTADLALAPTLHEIPTSGATFRSGFLDAVKNLDGVARVEPIARKEIQYQGLSIDLVSRGLRSELPLLFKQKSCIPDFLAGNAVLISETFSLRFKKYAGDSIELFGNGVPVCGVYYDYAGVRGEVYFTKEGHEKLETSAKPSSAAVFLEQGYSAGTIRQNILALLEDPLEVNVVETKWLRSEVMRIFDKTFVITYAVLSLSLVISAMGVFCALVILGTRQRSGFIMFGCLGASKAQIAISLVLQSTLLSVACYIAALISGLLIAYVLAAVINPQSFFWTIALEVAPMEIAEMFMIYLVTAIAASMFTLSLAFRGNLREVSRDE